jgi:WD40 repeat protein
MNLQVAPNPYVGPQSFTEMDAPRFFGRERELHDLVNLVIAERIVLLYAPSGAGKTSLLQAGLIPVLRDEGFRVLPLIRVNEPPDDTASAETTNRFVVSTLRSLEKGRPEEERIDLDSPALASITLKQYLDRLPRPRGDGIDGDGPEYDVLIFDQFEEILTIEPTSLAVRKTRFEFFDQIAEALYDSQRWAVFTLREDYLAGLDPYRQPVPTRLANHFRLDLLKVQDAGRAITLPPQAAPPTTQAGAAPPHSPFTFTEEAVASLLKDLGGTSGEGADQSAATQPDDALYIEPLHLQVVCARLWSQARPEPGSVITVDQIEASDDVDSALRAYYDEHVAKIAESFPEVEQRDIRDWFEHGLILKEQGIRGQVAHGVKQSGGLDNHVVDALVEAKLVNRETRLKATRYELAHDRLIGPVRSSNDSWSATHLNQTQRVAGEWDRADKPDTALLGVRDWVRAKRWSSQPGVQLRDYEQRFVDQSGAALTKRLLYVVLPVALFMAALVFYWRWEETNQSERANAITISSGWAGQALSWIPMDSDRPDQLDLGLLLAVEAVAYLEQAGVSPTFDVRHSLFNGLIARPYFGAPLSIQEIPNPRQGKDAPLAIRHDGRILATADTDGQVVLVDVPAQLSGAPAAALGVLPTSPNQGIGSASALAFSNADDPGTNLLAVGYADSAIGIWDLADPQFPVDLGSVRRSDADLDCDAVGTPCDRVTNLAFGEDGLLAAGYADGAIDVWDMNTAASPRLLHTLLRGDAVADCGVGSTRSLNACVRVTSLKFGQNGLLAAGYSDGAVWFWQDSREQQDAMIVDSLPETWPVHALAISPDGQFLAFGGQGGIFLQRLGRVQPSRPLDTEPVTGLAFNPLDTTALFSSHVTGEIIQWELSQLGNPVPIVERKATVSETTGQTVADLAFAPDGRWLISRAADSTVALWNPLGLPPIGEPVSGWTPAHSTCVASLEFDAEANILVSAGDDNMEREWELNRIPVTPVPSAPAATPSRLMRQGDEPPAPELPVQPGVSEASTPGSDVTAPGSCQDGGQLEQSEIVHESLLPRAAESGIVSPDGSFLAAGFENGLIVLWEDVDGEWEELGQLPGHTGAVSALSFHPVEDMLASGDNNGFVVVWNLDVDAWIDSACARAGRSLNDFEVNEYLIREPEEWESACSAPAGP